MEICQKKKKKMQRYAALEIKIKFFFYTVQIFRTHRILQNSSFSFKQNVRFFGGFFLFCFLFYFTNKGSLKKCLGFYAQEGVERVALFRLQRNVPFQE